MQFPAKPFHELPNWIPYVGHQRVTRTRHDRRRIIVAPADDRRSPARPKVTEPRWSAIIAADLLTYRRGVAQPGSAPALGAGGRRFKSYRPDQFKSSPVFRTLSQYPYDTFKPHDECD